jgi:serine phosphatase RsbU (regulator of sigma subunit)/Tfp pilus assembly protein PilF
MFLSVSVWAQQEELDSLQQLLHKQADDTSKVNTLNELSYVYYQTAVYDSELYYAQQALNLSQKLNWKRGMAVSLKNIGSACDDMGNNSDALYYYGRALNIFSSIDDKSGVSACYNNMGLVYRTIGNFSEALKNHYASLKIKEAIGDRNGIALSYNNIGVVLNAQKNYAEAIKNHLAALEIRKALGNKRGIASSYGNMGNVYQAQGNYAEALKNYEQTLKIEEEIGNKVGMTTALNNMGAAYYELGDYEQALQHNTDALRIAEEAGDLSSIAASSINTGNVLVKLKQPQAASEWLQKALEIGKEIGEVEVIKNSYEGLSQADSALGKYQDALHHYKMFISYRDSLVNEENTLKTVQLQMQYEYDKKDAIARAVQEKKDEVVRQEVQKQKLLRNSFVAGFALMLALAAVSYRSYVRKRKDNLLIEKQKLLVEEKNKEITQSLQYAQHIQEAVLPSHKNIDTWLKDYFIFYKPKDIVSGDFYSFIPNQGKLLVAAADCTGHGVAGAFMSMIGTSLINQLVNEKNITTPAVILDELNEGIINALKQRQGFSNDGMDIALICLDYQKKQLQFAGANRPLWLFRNHELLVVKPDKYPIGGMQVAHTTQFTNHVIELQTGDSCYLFSDGFADQFGGEQGKKLMSKRFKEYLMVMQHLPMDKQKEQLEQLFHSWKGACEQVDDVLVVGIKI